MLTPDELREARMRWAVLDLARAERHIASLMSAIESLQARLDEANAEAADARRILEEAQ